MANYIIAGESATFNDTPHFAGGIVPGDGIYTTWAYHAGPLRAQQFLLNPQALSAQTAQTWGIVAEGVSDGTTVTHAKALAAEFLKKPALTLRYTRHHFIQPLKERIVREVGYGLTLEGESARALVKSLGAE